MTDDVIDAIHGRSEILSGVYGPTRELAPPGALIGADTLSRGRAKGLDARTLLAAHDSYTFFDRIGDLVRTGPTRTDVNDIRADRAGRRKGGLTMHRHLRAKIVATVGPASSSPEMLRALFLAGVDTFRLNFSNGTHDDHASVNNRVSAGSISRILRTERYSVRASPPGKSARAVPPSGMNKVSPVKAPLPMTWVVHAGVCPGVCMTTAFNSPIE